MVCLSLLYCAYDLQILDGIMVNWHYSYIYAYKLNQYSLSMLHGRLVAQLRSTGCKSEPSYEMFLL